MSWPTNSIGQVVFSQLGSLISNRVYPVVMPQDVTYPAICYHVISVVPQATKSTTSVSDKIRIQVDMYGKDIDALNALASSVRDQLDLLSGTYSTINVSTCRFDGESIFYDDTLRLYHITHDYIMRINIK